MVAVLGLWHLGSVRLDRSDIDTIRRIVPKDRGLTWGER